MLNEKKLAFKGNMELGARAEDDMAKTESNGLLSFRSDVNILVLGEGDREYSFKFFYS